MSLGHDRATLVGCGRLSGIYGHRDPYVLDFRDPWGLGITRKRSGVQIGQEKVDRRIMCRMSSGRRRWCSCLSLCGTLCAGIS